MTDQERKAMEMALEALLTCDVDYDYDENPYNTFDAEDVSEAIEALRQALAQPEQDHGFDRTASHMTGEYVDASDTPSTCVDENEKRKHEPVTWIYEYITPDGEKYYADDYHDKHPSRQVPLYLTAPPSKPWVSLTDDDIKEGAKYSWVDYQAFQSVAWWADEKLKEKNT